MIHTKRSLPWLLSLALALPALAQDPVQTPEKGPLRKVEGIEASKLGNTANVHKSGDLYFAGQFEQGDIAVLRAAGIQRVISTRRPGEVTWDEAGELAKAGIGFVQVGFRGADTLTDQVFDEIRALLKQESGTTLFHCGSANRVGAAWLPYRVLDQGVDLETALGEAKTIGLRSPGLQERALAYIAARRATQEEKSVKEGINDSFKNPELDPESFVKRFEVESREVYAARQAILAACQLEPGSAVADVGAGTGIYTWLFSEAVGAKGWVYAVDIAAPFVQRIVNTAHANKVTNVTGVICPENAVGLPPNSIDFAYTCDTYHHFEYPMSTLRSIHAALRPGGRFVIVDFERIPGTSREWILGHVRAGKEEVRAEVEAAGFTFTSEVKIEGLSENYFIEFQKK